MIRIMMILGTLALAACDEVSYSVQAPGVDKSVKLISVELPGRKPEMLNATELKDPTVLAGAKELLGDRCQTVSSLDRFEGNPVGGDIVVYRATCESGAYQLLQIGEQVAIGNWTGKLVNPLAS